MTEESKPEKKPTAKRGEPRVVVKILKHRTKVGSFVCAVGAQLKVPQSKADALTKANLAEIVGV